MTANRLLDSFQKSAEEILPRVVETRRCLHANPELAFEEIETAKLVVKRLRELGISVWEGVAKTGVLGLIEGGKPGPTIALRADLDALPIHEETGLDFQSANPGKMHACGHDAHTASLLGTAEILVRHRNELPGNVQLIFQPSEEKLPGGASVMVAEGVLERFQATGIVGQHVMPLLDVGQIGIRSGRYMASADEIYITVYGVGGHGAQPHTTVDPVAIGAQLITALQQIISRNADPRMPSVLTFGKVIANGATNVIPPKMYLEGTFRTFDEKWREDAHRRIVQLAKGLVEGMGGTIEIEIKKGYPVLNNDPELTRQTRTRLEQYVGKENVVDLDLWMAAEDFAYYTHRLPGCFYRLGTRGSSVPSGFGLHHPRFTIDESALGISTGLMAWVALGSLTGELTADE
jgi:amidohydrolase